MSIPLQDYAQLKVFINDAPITQIKSASRKTDAGLIEINLMNEGLGGFSHGAGSMKIDVGFTVPIGGPEYDYEGMAARKEFVTMQVWAGTSIYSGKGKLSNVEISQSEGQATEGTMSWTGELKAPEV